MRVNFEHVVKQGILTKKGSILGLYNNECMFYLERSRTVSDDHKSGPYLKYGPKKKAVQFFVDLGAGAQGGKVHLIRVPGSKTKFHIQIPGETVKLKLKAASNQDRESWIESICQEIKTGVSDDAACIENGGDGLVDESKQNFNLTKDPLAKL